MMIVMPERIDDVAVPRNDNAVLIAQLRRRRKMIRRSGRLFRTVFCLILAAVPLLLCLLILRGAKGAASPLHLASCFMFIAGFSLLIANYLIHETRDWAAAPELAGQMREILLERRLLAACLSQPDPHAMLDPQLLDSEFMHLDEIPTQPQDAAARIEFLLLYFRELEPIRLAQAADRIGKLANSSDVQPQDGMRSLATLRPGALLCLIDVLIGILAEQSDNTEPSDG